MKILFSFVTVPLLVLCVSVHSLFAQGKLGDELEKAFALPAKQAGDRIYMLCVNHVVTAATDSLAKANADLMTTAVSASNLANKLAINYEIKANCAKRFMELEEAKNYIQIALRQPTVPQNQMERLLILLAYVETDLENYLGAVESYGMVEAGFQRTKNNFMLVRNYISMADLYTKCGLYRESIDCLAKAKMLRNKSADFEMPNIFYENMANNYFYLGKADSLDYYYHQLLALKNRTPDDDISLFRLRSMLLMLKGDPAAIDEMKKIIHNPKDTDKLMSSFLLAQAYVRFHRNEEAKVCILKMLSAGDVKSSNYLCSKLYKLLGDVYTHEQDFKQSALYYKKSMEETALTVQKQLKSENVLAALKYYDFKNRYAIAEQDLKTRNNYILLLSLVALMVISILIVLYRSLKLKKRYNEIRINKLNDELSAMNSHEVRRYLCNILGIVKVIKMSDDKHGTYLQMEEALLDSAENLDVSIKNIAHKLTEQTKIYN